MKLCKEICKEQSSVELLWEFCQELQRRIDMLKQCFPSDKSRKEVSKIEYRNVARKKEIESKLQIGKTQPLRING